MNAMMMMIKQRCHVLTAAPVCILVVRDIEHPADAGRDQLHEASWRARGLGPAQASTEQHKPQRHDWKKYCRRA